MTLRRALCLGLLLASFAAIPQSDAQDWPSRNINVVVPLGAGSASDIVARVVMEQVGRQLGQTVVVENRPGAGGTIGANLVAKAAPDGYTILAYGALANAHALHTKLPYDSINDLIPVASLGQQYLVVVSAPSKGFDKLGDLITAAKANPGKLNFSSVGPGSASHMAAERLRTTAGFDAQQIPFKGAAEAITDVVAGRVDFTAQPLTTTVALIREGKLRALAVSAHKRAALMPDVPTLIEAGLPPSSVYPFYTGVYLPAKTPQAIVDKLAAEVAKAVQVEAVRARLAQLGVEPMPMTPAEFAQFTKDDIEANIALVKAANIPTQ